MNEHHPKPMLLEGIIEFQAWSIENPFHGMEYLQVNWHGVVFVKNFGPWKQGDSAYNLIFDPFHSRLVETNNWDEIVKECKLEFSVATS